MCFAKSVIKLQMYVILRGIARKIFETFSQKKFKERFLIFTFISKKEYEILLKNGIVKIFLRFEIIFLFNSNLYSSKD